ncbi:hypothetical protein GCM10007063_33060 [Lentibacillus kapialis]|uniref:Uncharacterized protein n=1 Tax=Lentibacillus kapialis TaxID=340214 RepID=A0A917Q2H6_9BACI|nr:hypothetical protein GCM10007063_33060 [Lentibacillus kapialis]
MLILPPMGRIIANYTEGFWHKSGENVAEMRNFSAWIHTKKNVSMKQLHMCIVFHSVAQSVMKS